MFSFFGSKTKVGIEPSTNYRWWDLHGTALHVGSS
jgi:hypothetical protein